MTTEEMYSRAKFITKIQVEFKQEVKNRKYKKGKELKMINDFNISQTHFKK